MIGPMRRIPCALVFLACSVVRIGAQADVVELKAGPPFRARIWERGGGDEDAVVNVFRTGIRRATHGVERIPAKKLKRLVDDPDPHRAFWRAADELADGGTADAWFALAADAKAKKLPGLARHAALEALVRDPAHAEAKKSLGDKAAAIVAADPRLNAQLADAQRRYLATEELAARLKIAEEIGKLGGHADVARLERAYRSSKEPRGRVENRPLTLRSKDHRGVYTLFVPPKYDPFVPTPLVVGLHGGGRGGKDGQAVVGSGVEAMAFYERGAAALGWLVVCPTAIEAPWAAKANDGFVLAVVEEIGLRFNVDVHRVYLTGHSMGGFGTWHFGPLYATKWAAIAPMAGGGGGGGLKRLADTRTGVYLYHGADDAVVGVGSDRAAADAMRKAEMDFVYAEIPDSGHGFPPEVEAEMWEFLKPRRLAIAADGEERGPFAVAETVRSSFVAKPGKDETEAFGPLGKEAPHVAGAAELKRLLEDLRAGGGRSEKAAPLLGARKDAETATAVARVLADPKAEADVRRRACDALGLIGRKEGAKALAAALADRDLSVVGAAGEAFGRVDASDKPKTYDRALAAMSERFEAAKSGGGMDYSDYEAFCDALSRFCVGIAATNDPACGAVAEKIADRFLLPELRVRATARAGQNPATPRKKLATALLAACAALPGPAADAARAKIVARPEFADR
jgi:pimeloyl-ACP methyl ester carboxylesterase